ncbi:MAG: PspC domain-containing protein [Desulfobacterales bacterium]|nr:PspC domain-containing protein [Desulfobacterales bacterium]
MRTFKQREGRGIYRARDGAVLGVCKGLADYFDFKVGRVRFLTVVIMILSGLWPIVAVYFVASLIMKPEPVRPLTTEDEKEFYNSYLHSRQGVTGRIKRRYENLESRIRRLEDAVTAREFDWDRKFDV